jgi:hypothetical protein
MTVQPGKEDPPRRGRAARQQRSISISPQVAKPSRTSIYILSQVLEDKIKIVETDRPASD